VRKAIQQGAAALVAGVLVFLAGSFGSTFSGVMETVGVLIAVAGAVTIVLGIVTREK
jgi:hypothetical protein